MAVTSKMSCANVTDGRMDGSNDRTTASTTFIHSVAR